MTEMQRLERIINEGVRHHGAGNLRDASKHYQQVLAENPKHAVALHLLGVVALQSGDNEGASQLIAHALEVAPNYAEAHSNLGNVFQAMGRFEEAALCYERALSIDPQAAEVRANWGNATLQLGDHKAAVIHFSAALNLNPNLPEAHRNMGVALLALGRPYDAWQSVVRSQQLHPNSVELHLTAGNVLQALRRYDSAIQCYSRVLQVRKNFPPVLCNLGNVHRAKGSLKEAASYYDRAIEIDEHYAVAHHDRGAIYQDLGDMDAAERCFHRAIAIDPLDGKSHHSLASLRKRRERNADVAAMEKSISDPAILHDQKMFMAYGLGKSFEDMGSYEQAFEYYELANGLRRSAIDYSIEQDAALFQNIQNTFSKSLFDRLEGGGIADTTPVFIVGMPRSGTSLIEQILASHHQIHGAGELDELLVLIANSLPTKDGVDYTAGVPSAVPELFATIAAAYVKHLRNLSPSATFVTDKLPTNFLNVGMIHLLFPNARIIHCQRNPIDTCLSIYKNYFAASGHNYSYDLKELGLYYGFYRDLMAHWNSVLPGKMVNIAYEELVTNQESTTRHLIDACGLPWDPSCMEFHNTRRAVFTNSAAQVRRPIYSDSVQLWRQYEKQLEPLIESLPVE